MKVGRIKLTVIVLVAVSALASNYVLASAGYSDDPNDPNDPNNHNFVWVVALEINSPNEVHSHWSPTLYKISVEAAKVVEKKKIAEQGVPIFCHILPHDEIRVILGDGLAAHGATYIGEQITIDLTVDKSDMRILESKTEEGYESPEEYMNLVLSDPNKKLNIDKPEQLVRKTGEAFLGTSKTLSRVFMLKGFLENKETLSLEILDSALLTSEKSIPLKVGSRKLGGFCGPEWGDVTLIAERYVVCLFDGYSPLGTFGPGYVMVVDTESEIVRYVAIGSDPARGIVY